MLFESYSKETWHLSCIKFGFGFLLLFEVYETLIKAGENGTLDTAFSIISWSFNALQSGKWPYCDWKGKKLPGSRKDLHIYHRVDSCERFLIEKNNTNGLRYPPGSLGSKRAGLFLAGGWRAVVTGVIGDLDYLCGTLQLPRWSRADNNCALCRCERWGQYTWKCFERNAAWITTCWSPSTWKNWGSRSQCKLWNIQNLSACNVGADWMHAKYLGSDLVAFASILWVSIFVLSTSTPTEALGNFNKFLKEWYSANKTTSRFSNFESTRLFMNKKGFKLKGKAAQVKCFGQPLLQYWLSIYNAEVHIQRIITLYLKLNVKCEHLLDMNKGELFLGHLSCSSSVQTLVKNLECSCFFNPFVLQLPHTHKLTQEKKMLQNLRPRFFLWHTFTTF